jgi:hypothetical protein
LKNGQEYAVMFEKWSRICCYGISDFKKCPDPLDTRSCSGGAYPDSGKSLGQVDIPLTPGRIYYILFENIARLSESK